MTVQTTIAGESMTLSRDAARDAEFSAWMAARQASLHRTAYLISGDHHTAEDLVATTLSKVYLSWHKINQRDSLDGYARRIMVNEHNTLWRRAFKRREVPAERLPEHDGVSDTYDEGEHDEMWQLLQTLPRRQRAVIVLRYYEQLSEAEIAELLSISPGTVKSQASRALATLRERAATAPAPTRTTTEALGEEER